MENVMLLRMEKGKLRATDGKRVYFPDRSVTDLKEGFIRNIEVTIDKGTYAFIKFEYVTFEGVSDENIEDAFQFRPYLNAVRGVVNCIPVFLNSHWCGNRLIIGNGNKLEEVYTNNDVNVYYEDKAKYYRALALTKELEYVRDNMLSDHSGNNALWEKIYFRRYALILEGADVINIEDSNTLLSLAKEVINWQDVHVRILDDKVIAVGNPDIYQKYYIIKNGEVIHYEVKLDKPKKVVNVSNKVLEFVESNKIATHDWCKDNHVTNEAGLYNDTLLAYRSGALIPNKLNAFGNNFTVWTHYLKGIEKWSDVKEDVKQMVNDSVEALEKEVKSIGKKVGVGSIDQLNQLNWKKKLVRK